MKTSTYTIIIIGALASAIAVTSIAGRATKHDTISQAEKTEKDRPGIAETRAIAKEAYIYGFPMVDSYRIQHDYFVDRASREFKASWSQIVYRMGAAVLGIYGNSKQEAMYPVYRIDANGQKLTGANRYTLRFAPGQLPPVKEANWLPAPKGPFATYMRLYWPKEEALEGKWTAPKLKKAE